MNIEKSITYIIEDQEWISKTLLAAIISNVPILNLAWIGYIIEITRNVADHDPEPLPDWSRLGQNFISGLLLMLAALIYSLPVLVIAIFPMFGIFLGFIPAEENLQEYAAGAFGIALFILVCCIVVYAILLSFYFPGVMINYARKGKFGACFQIREIFDIIFGNAGEYLLALVVAIAASIGIGMLISAISLLFVWIVCIGWILLFIVGAVANVWIGTIFAHLLGQVGSGYSTNS